jgi:hypothetical protein
MEVKYYEEEKVFELILVRDPDWQVFGWIANEITETFNVQWRTQLDGFDQSYWDFEFKGIHLSLHLEHILGISIFFEKTIRDVERAKQVLQEIGNHFKTWNPPN